MAETRYGRLLADGLWHNNPALVQILGLCPLLAVTGSVANGLGMGLATTAVLVASNVTVSLIRGLVRPEVRIPVYVLVIASFVTAVELLMNAWFYDLYKVLGIFVPLIVTNCTIIGRAEAFASRNRVLPAALDGLAMGLGFTAVLVTLGGLREVVGQGTLFSQMGVMFGEALAGLEITVIPDYRGFLVAILPPGAFLGMGLLIALKNVIDRRAARRRTAAVAVAAPAPEAG
ncbi:electron transport complex subunit E [Inmirania thermothiophila]|uniref:Ion-translocating oxidoreductase complex subunit E n=1 Tax=Inmirania thermothiophila TaxID=1750597 RepID=A0A3N1Y928_9GAMM|nr:electron transport complex subunit E [Inmirania thermothiophila]ROR35051.1 electron transport complex protein RnfE [Inmirania thermothiophila]